MKRIIASCFFILSLCAIAQGQDSYMEGYIVIAPDTVEGFVKVLPARKLGTKCFFKREKSMAHTEYSVNEIESFGIKNYKYFESVDLDSLTRFAEIIVNGNAKLLKYKSDYYVKKDGKTLLLKSELVETRKGQSSFREVALRFKDDLKLLLSDCGEVESKIDSLQKANENSLVELIKFYHSCIGKTPYVVKKKVEKKIIKASIFGGIGISTLNLNQRSRSVDYLNDRREMSNNPFFGISMDVYFPRSGLLSALNFRIQFTGSDYGYELPGDPLIAVESEQVSVKMNQIKLSSGITKRLNFVENLYVLGGGIAVFNAKIDPIYTVTFTSGRMESRPAFNSRKFQFGAWLGTRYNFLRVGASKIYLEYNFEMISGPTKSVTALSGTELESSSTVTSHLFNLGLTF